MAPLDFTSTNTVFFVKGDPDDAYYRVFHSRGGANELSGGFSNPTVDGLLEEGEATIDAQKRTFTFPWQMRWLKELVLRAPEAMVRRMAPPSRTQSSK